MGPLSRRVLQGLHEQVPFTWLWDRNKRFSSQTEKLEGRRNGVEEHMCTQLSISRPSADGGDRLTTGSTSVQHTS